MGQRLFQKIYDTVTGRPQYLFAVLWCAVALLTLPAWRAGFNGDFEGLLDYYSKYRFWDFLNSKDFNVKSYYQVTHLQLFLWISLFWTKGMPWFLLLTGLHALNSTLIFSFCQKLLGDFRVKAATAIALGGALLFALNPNVTEITIWKGGYHYLPGVLAQLLILGWTRSFMLTGQRKFAVYTAILFFFSTFTLEIFYLTPWFCLILILAYYWKNSIDKAAFSRTLKFIFLPQLALFLFHLLIFRLRFGSWVAHYGPTGDFFFTAKDFLPKMLKYLVTLLGFTSHMPYETAHPVYTFLDKPFVYYSAYSMALLLAAIVLIRFKKLPPRLQAATILFGMMMLCIIIISPMYFDDTMQLYNSRRCYELSFPVYMLLSIGIFSLLPATKLPRVLLTIYLCSCVLLAVGKSYQWRRADYMQRTVLRQYKWQNTPHVLILNLPCYYRDIRIIATSKWDEFQENLNVFGFDSSRHKIQYISAYNMNSLWDGAHVTMLDSATLKVTLNQWGSWWMYNLNGATDVETEDYQLEMKDVGHEYLLHLKKPASYFTILYQQADQWKVVDPAKREEQW